MSTLHAFSTDAFPYTVGYVSELLGLSDSELNHYARTLGIAQQHDERTGKLIFFHKDVELLKRATEMVKGGETIDYAASRLIPNRSVTEHSSVHSSGNISASPSVGNMGSKGASNSPVNSHLGHSPYVSTPNPSPTQGPSSHSSIQSSMRFQMAEPTASPYSPESFPGSAQSQQNMGITVSPPGAPKPIQHQASAPTMSQSMSSSSLGTSRDALAMMVETVSNVKDGILKDLSRMLDDKLSGLDEVVVQLIRAQSENETLKKRIDELHQRNSELESELTSFKPVQFGFYKKTR